MRVLVITFTAATLIAAAIVAFPSNGIAQLSDSKQPKRTEMGQKPEMQTLIACNPFALDINQRKRKAELWARLAHHRSDVRELSDGYAIGLASDAQVVLAAAEFIALERSCCPFFRFELAINGTDELMWLRITGPDGAKEVLESELK